MAYAKSLLTPKELADAIGVSESSLRRWVDSGDIRMSRTAGGHRRIPLADAIQFIRKIGATVVRGEMLGLSESHREEPALLGLSDDDRLFEVLKAGERGGAKGLILSWYLNGQSLAGIFDGPVRAALHRLGEMWKHDERAILIEHRATEICVEAVAALQGVLPAPDVRAPLALGAAPQGDPYQLPTMMAAAVLCEVGFRQMNFGANTPVKLLAAEAVERNARLVWLSISARQDPGPLRTSIRKLAAALAERRIELVLGGRYHAECAPRGMQNITLVDSMNGLVAMAEKIVGVKAERASLHTGAT